MCFIYPNAMISSPGARILRPEKGVYSIGLDLVIFRQNTAGSILQVTDESAVAILEFFHQPGSDNHQGHPDA